MLRSIQLAACAAIIGSASNACTDKRSPESSDISIVQKSIQSEIEESLEATRRKDIDAFMSGFAPEFSIDAKDGDQGSLKDLRAHTLRDWAIIPATRDLWMKIDSMGSVAADTAVVYTSQRWDRLMLQRDGVTKDTVITTQKHRELWKHTPHGWRRARITELGGTVMVNGKPFQ